MARENPTSEVLLIVAATVQLRMYTSPLFSQYSDVFVEEPEDGDLRHRSFKTPWFTVVPRYKRLVPPSGIQKSC